MNASSQVLARIALVVLLVLVITSGCNPDNPSVQSGIIEQTRIALEQKLTQQALEAEVLRPTQLQATNNGLATIAAQQSTQLAEQITQQAAASQTAEASALISTPTSQQTPDPLADTINQIKASRIILYENMSGQKINGLYHPRYVQAALDRAGYSYTNVGSALGWLKDNLLSGQQWDLIIASSEASNKLQGEYFKYILNHINEGASVILEVYDLDALRGGSISPILDMCGVEYSADWTRVATPLLWQLVPDHPIFHFPNDGISTTRGAPFWPDDHGDLLKTMGDKDAILLLGTMQGSNNDHGTLVTCLDNRILIQTFRSHDFAQVEMESLWENYIYFVLNSKYQNP